MRWLVSASSKPSCSPFALQRHLAARPLVIAFSKRRQQQRPSQPQRQCGTGVQAAALTPDTLFGVATLAVMPFYALVIAAPRRPLTRRLLSPDSFFLAASALYAGLLAAWRHLLPPAWAVLRDAASAAVSARVAPDVAAFSALFSSPGFTALAWVHLLLLDLFQARWVWQDGLRCGVPVAHSAVLCFMVGPLGLLSHYLTKLVWRLGRKEEAEYVLYSFD